MKKKIIDVLVLLLLVILIAFVLKIIFSKDFYINKDNKFLFSDELSISEIKLFIESYDLFVNSFFNINGFTKLKIEDQDLNIIICKNSFNEFSDKNLIYSTFISQMGKNKKYLQRIINISNLEMIDYRYCYGLNTILLSKNSNLPLDKVSGNFKTNSTNDDDMFSYSNIFKFLILSYHQHIIYNNLSEELKRLFNLKSGIIPYKSKNYSNMMIEYIYSNFIINSIESFYKFILLSNNILDEENNFQNLKDFEKKLVKDKLFLTNKLLIKDEILDLFIKFYQNQKTAYNSFDDFYTDLITENLESNKDELTILKNKFIAKILIEYDFTKLKKFIDILYNKKIDSISKIFEIEFGISFKDFLKTLIEKP